LAAKFLENCLKKDIGTSPSLTCLFYNNLAGIYFAAKKYEKAFKYTKKSLYILEPEVLCILLNKLSINSRFSLKLMAAQPDNSKKILVLRKNCLFY